jgi:hypothetical protein
MDRLGGQAKTLLITHLQQINRFTVLDRDNMDEGSCATPPAVVDYASFKDSKPRSILMLPPVNESPDVKATYSLLS